MPGLELGGRDVAESACNRSLLNQATHSTSLTPFGRDIVSAEGSVDTNAIVFSTAR